MLTFYHAPNSRSTSVLALIKQMGIEDRIDIREVSIRRMDGPGTRDPANPQPDGKVPCLTDGDALIYERGAVMLYLTDQFPAAGLGPQVGDPKRGDYLRWLFYYQGVIEPVVMIQWAGIEDETLRYMLGSFADIVARIDAALAHGPWLLGDKLSAADLLVSSMFIFAKIEPEQQRVRDWIARSSDLEAVKTAWAQDNAQSMAG